MVVRHNLLTGPCEVHDLVEFIELRIS